MALSDLDVEIEAYHESDSSSIQALELDCAQSLAPDFPFKYVKFARVYHQPYHSRVQMFPNSFTLVARCVSEKRLIGFSSGAIKQAYYDTELVCVGYIFDLRVHDKYLRRGVGLALVKKTEELLIEKGATLLYGIVFAANEKAEMLFEGNLEYKLATKKTIHMENIEGKEKEGEFKLEEVSRDQAIKGMQAAFKDRDLMVKELGEIVGRQEYLGTVCVNDGQGNKAEVSLWDGTAHMGKAITEVYYPTELIITPQFYVPFFLCSALVFTFGFLSTLNIYDVIPEQILKLVFATAMMLVAIFALEFVVVFAKYWRVCVKHPRGERKLLLFGLHFVGNPDIKEVLYDDLFLGIKTRFKNKADILCWFVDECDPDAGLFNSNMHRVIYLQKKLKAMTWNAWTRSLFSDPRELA